MRKAIIVALCAAALSGVASVHTQTSTPTELFFSEYLEGTSNNKALEIYTGRALP